jgi:hypothetical protein
MAVSLEFVVGSMVIFIRIASSFPAPPVVWCSYPKKRTNFMEHPLPVQRATIAWFKLAEFVTRKEKERAIVALKLLSHSIADKACSLLIEADLLHAFKDERAIVAYERSAQLYVDRQEPAQGAFIYEHLAQLTGDMSYLYTAMQVCAQERFIETWSRCAAQVGRLLIESRKYDQIPGLLEQLQLNTAWSAWVLGELILAAVRVDPIDELLVAQLSHHLVDISITGPQGNLYLNQTLARLAAIRPAAYDLVSRLCDMAATSDCKK